MSYLLESGLDKERLQARKANDKKDRAADRAMFGTLEASVVNEVQRLRAGWTFVGAAFQQPSPHCEECSYCEHKGQMLPYGEGQAYEAYMECALGRNRKDRPEDCPAYAEHLKEQEEEQ